MPVASRGRRGSQTSESLPRAQARIARLCRQPHAPTRSLPGTFLMALLAGVRAATVAPSSSAHTRTSGPVDAHAAGRPGERDRRLLSPHRERTLGVCFGRVSSRWGGWENDRPCTSVEMHEADRVPARLRPARDTGPRPKRGPHNRDGRTRRTRTPTAGVSAARGGPLPRGAADLSPSASAPGGPDPVDVRRQSGSLRTTDSARLNEASRPWRSRRMPRRRRRAQTRRASPVWPIRPASAPSTASVASTTSLSRPPWSRSLAMPSASTTSRG